MTDLITMTVDEWQAEGARRFGPDQMSWQFVCPSCGHVAKVSDWKEAGAPQTAVAFSCIGRWTPSTATLLQTGTGPCDYAGGGLFQLNPVQVEGSRLFAFADAPAAVPSHA
jgi:predicted RNA-binding Zn-ribbon protein involved in translation (DUF1610 family)